MVGVSRASSADQTRLRGYEFEVGFVAEPPRFADRQHALVDLAVSGVGLKGDRFRRAVIDDRLGGDCRRSRWLGCGLDLSGPSPRSLDGGRGRWHVRGGRGFIDRQSLLRTTWQEHSGREGCLDELGVIRQQAVLGLQDADRARLQVAFRQGVWIS